MTVLSRKAFGQCKPSGGEIHPLRAGPGIPICWRLRPPLRGTSMNLAIGRNNWARALLVLFLPLYLAGCGVNDIPTKDEQVKAAWGDVQNQYQRRADLVPNLVATVQGYA